MCGIVGAIAQRDIGPILIEGLRRLEYRGYDSAGVAVVTPEGQLESRRVEGKVEKLAELLNTQPLLGKIGIGHTRWATHGKPSQTNAHPHSADNGVTVVHNGVIENYAELKAELISEGYIFHSDTDTETIVHLVHRFYRQGMDFLSAVKATVARLKGIFSVLFLDPAEPDRLIAVRQGSPLVIGIGIDEHFVASDRLALAPVVDRYIYLEEGDIASVYYDHVTIYDAQDQEVLRKLHYAESSYTELVSRGAYRHYMLKEIFEQPHAVAATVQSELSGCEFLDRVRRIQIAACGTSYHAGCVARYWFEAIAGIPCHVEVASEWRYREVVVEPDTLFIVLSQSGETADTLAALRKAKLSGYIATLAICNVSESMMVREADYVLMTAAGPEVGVASTKAFTAQLTTLLLLCSRVAQHLGKNMDALKEALSELPQALSHVLQLDAEIKACASLFSDKPSALFIARGIYYPIVLEGALKLKELSYIHAEAYPAGELKHGALALVDKDMPVIVLAPDGMLLQKVKSNVEEIAARGGRLLIFSESEWFNVSAERQRIHLPRVNALIAPIVYTVPLQLLAYYVAVLKGTDVDQPRNLAKSVTVE